MPSTTDAARLHALIRSRRPCLFPCYAWCSRSQTPLSPPDKTSVRRVEGTPHRWLLDNADHTLGHATYSATWWPIHTQLLRFVGCTFADHVRITLFFCFQIPQTLTALNLFRRTQNGETNISSVLWVFETSRAASQPAPDNPPRGKQ